MKMGLAVADMILAQGNTSPPIIAYDHYVVKPGESLSLIAGRVLGDPMRWKEIWNINPQIANPDQISVGSTINIPAGTIANSTDPAKNLPGPRQSAVVTDTFEDSGESFLNSPLFLVGAAGVALLIILMATKKAA